MRRMGPVDDMQRPTASTAATSAEAVLAALRRRRYSLARINKAFGQDVEFLTVVGNLALVIEDRPAPGKGDWIPRSRFKGGSAKNYLYHNVLRQDRGIIKRFQDGSVLVHGRDSGKGHLYKVSPAPHRKAKFLCDEDQCRQRLKKHVDPNTDVWCYHVDTRRIDAGYTRIEDVQAPFLPLPSTRPRPQTGRRLHADKPNTPPKPKPAKPAQAQEPPSLPPRPQLRGARAQPGPIIEVMPTPTPVAIYAGVKLEVGALKLSVAALPVTGLKRLLEDVRNACGDAVHVIRIEGQPDLTAEMILDAASGLGVGRTHDVEDLLAKALPEWLDLEEGVRRKVRTRFSQVIITDDFRVKANKVGWQRCPSPKDGRKFRYGVKA